MTFTSSAKTSLKLLTAVSAFILSSTLFYTGAVVYNFSPVCELKAKIIRISNTELTFNFTLKIFEAQREISLLDSKSEAVPATEKDSCVQMFPSTTTVQINGNKQDFYTDPLYEPHVGQIIQVYAQNFKNDTMGKEQTDFLDFRNDKHGIELLKDYGNLPSDNPITQIANFIKDLLAKFNLYL
ncbi:hypothetical protein A3B64_03895 [candidate division WWE3 bacterium RIFCSPLOWO2_01_FULL_37_24]|nr:MAG: hypothetical protein A2793_02645 [candidate division WWE3 bacterium RIFCSPHIGHO2_01_FULL_38_45]OGC52639.1 MAG: hypothetical protein A3B64_03895 [candidate division WWE3 bacterium RIFCSPLOWO2_01_FULL_37_24]HLB51471.1 hypothetical protein [Patescibacteria group bacterium]